MSGDRILIDKQLCLGNGLCVLAAPNIFTQDEEAVVELLDETPIEEDAERARDAALQCPTGALRVVSD